MRPRLLLAAAAFLGILTPGAASAAAPCIVECQTPECPPRSGCWKPPPG